MLKFSADAAQSEIMRRAQKLKDQKRRRTMGMLSGACVTLIGLLVAVFVSLFAPMHGTAPQALHYGASLIPEEMGGYVLVGVLCFCLAVVLTLLCVKYRETHKK